MDGIESFAQQSPQFRGVGDLILVRGSREEVEGFDDFLVEGEKFGACVALLL